MRILVFLILICTAAMGQSAVDEPQDQKIEAKELKAEQSFTEGMKLYLIEDFEKAYAEFRKGIQAYGENASILFMLSKTEMALNRIPAALISAKKASDLDKENFFYLQHLGNLQFKQNQYKEATNTIKKALKLKPNFVEGYLNLVDIYLIEGKESEALKTLADMEESMGSSEQITQAKQTILLKQNKVDAALKEGKKMVKTDPQYVLQQSSILISNSRFSEAAQMLKNAIDENPNFMEAYGLLAETYAKQNNKQGTKDVLNSILAQNSLPYSLKANALGSYFSSLKNNTQTEDITDALNFCDQIIAKHPEEARTYVYKADLLVKSNQILAARDAYLNAIKYDKGIFEAWLAIVELDVKLAKYDDLLKHSEKATEYYPNHSYFWYHLGFAQIQTKNYSDALISLEEAQALNTNNKELRHHINASMAEIYHQNGKLDKAKELFEQVLAENPNNEQALNNYSYLLATSKKDLDKAVVLSERLIKSYPNQAANYDTFAWVLFQRGEYNKANEAIELAIAKDKNGSESIFEHKGDILFKLGQTENAVSAWKKALELNKSNKKLENKIKERTIIE
ncbi:tetratricopeptide repeat protein [Lacihabitans soyangensis]|uniref:Tetratricopeptide repeat protein n=1 Tax=Lacihabitans soyangensis TaxID=869394 RepID=A0AAE3KWF6_9BACT|nr:tetratricopeptide repeat protein [Lacihabitans soyangensis]MCP9762805.1 tetratricopeptide repeat protein [Lacihabitans soyangensis]